METIKMLIEQGRAIRGMMVRVKGTMQRKQVCCADEVGVYLEGDHQPYDPESLILTAEQPHCV